MARRRRTAFHASARGLVPAAAVVALTLAAAPLHARAGATYTSSYSFVSAAGDYIGQGATASYAEPSATFGMSGSVGSLQFSVSTSTEWWYVDLAAPIGQQLQSGTTYTNAMRAAFRTGSAPGLDVFGDGRGCNTVYGQFTINSIASDSSGNVTLLDATFTQNCEQPTAPPLNGVVKYRIPHIASTSTALSTSASTAPYATAVTFTATVTPSAGGAATGSVTFADGGTTLGTGTLDASGTATLTTWALAIGSHSITAAYGGDAGDTASTSPAVSVVVQQDATATALTSSSSCSRRGQAVTFTATVGSSPSGTPAATGAVTFLDGSASLGSALLSSGRATLTTASLALGTHTIRASYGGDATHNASASAALTQTVVNRRC